MSKQGARLILEGLGLELHGKHIGLVISILKAYCLAISLGLFLKYALQAVKVVFYKHNIVVGHGVGALGSVFGFLVQRVIDMVMAFIQGSWFIDVVLCHVAWRRLRKRGRGRKRGTFGTVKWKAEKWNERAFSCLFVLENGIGESILILIPFSAFS
ncbi:hypothetical protein Tco_0276972 [Tanacetum coccineum]